MSTKLHRILSKSRETEFDFSLISQFELDNGQKIDPQRIITERIWHPYTLDIENESVIFLDMPQSVDLSQSAFIYPRQFSEATQLLSVPYADLWELSAQVRIPQQISFIFSSGRCGSTLLHQILNQVDEVYSYSEPDLTTILSLQWQEKSLSDALVGDIIEAATRLQIHALVMDDAKQITLKFRGQVTPLAPFYLERFPQSKTIVMYRNPLNWARSMFRFLMLFFDNEWLNLDEIYFRLRMYPQKSVSEIGHYLDLSKPRFHRAEQIAFLLIIQLEIYQQAIETYNVFPLHYDDLLANPETVISNLLNYCDISSSQISQALKGLERDSQAGTGLARNFDSWELDDEAEALFLSVLRMHPEFGQDDFRL